MAICWGRQERRRPGLWERENKESTRLLSKFFWGRPPHRCKATSQSGFAHPCGMGKLSIPRQNFDEPDQFACLSAWISSTFPTHTSGHMGNGASRQSHGGPSVALSWNGGGLYSRKRSPAFGDGTRPAQRPFGGQGSPARAPPGADGGPSDCRRPIGPRARGPPSPIVCFFPTSPGKSMGIEISLLPAVRPRYPV